MTEPRDNCWNVPRDGHQADCPLGREEARDKAGPDHRPMDPAWARALRDRCAEAGVAFFFKQWGGRTPKAGGRVLDGRTWDEYPATRRAEA